MNISDVEEFGTVNESKYIERTLEGTQDAFKLSTEGVIYGDTFWDLLKRGYEEFGGATRSGEMLNRDKQTRAETWAREQMKVRGVQGQMRVSESNEEIFKLSPEIHGMGVNLKALWNKIRTFFITKK